MSGDLRSRSIGSMWSCLQNCMCLYSVRTAVGIASLVVCFSAVAAPIGAQTPRDSIAVHAAVTTFLRAFENLDWERFRNSFSDSATVFFPIPEPPQRFEGRRQVESQFKEVFEGIREGATSGPPYHHLNAARLRIEMLGSTAALVSFELRSPTRTARRTLVVRLEGKSWRIVHLHASNVAEPATDVAKD